MQPFSLSVATVRFEKGSTQCCNSEINFHFSEQQLDHPIMAAEIVEKSWDLSLYELHRTPHEAITDSTDIAVSPKVKCLIFYKYVNSCLF